MNESDFQMRRLLYVIISGMLDSAVFSFFAYLNILLVGFHIAYPINAVNFYPIHIHNVSAFFYAFANEFLCQEWSSFFNLEKSQ